MKRSIRPALLVLVLVLAACQPRAVANDPVVASVRANDVAAVAAFVADGGDVNLTDREGNPLLYLATGPQGGPEVAAALIAAGARLEIASANGRRPLENAVGWCDVDMVQLLLFAGADPMPLADGRAEDVACKAPADRRATVLAMIASAIGAKIN
ncbi:MAG: hypothetical protein KKH72_12795 [Alphaproteobacteria bacterium]|nr:hypothetical protein [Alphaproteobacteria bacterium]